MKNFFALLSIIFMASCAPQPPLFVGTGVINGKPVELQTKICFLNECPPKAKGWLLLVAGEEMGILYLDGKADDGRQEFFPLETKYGVFDAISELNMSTSYTVKFSITLNGEYVGTVVGSVN